MGKHTQSKTLGELAPEVGAHLSALAFATVEQYQSWCNVSGFATRLRKSGPEREQELRFRQHERGSHSLQGARSLKRHPENTFRLLLSPNTPPALLLRPDLAAIASLSAELKHESGARTAFLALLLIANRHTGLLRADPVLERYGQETHNSYIGALQALAQHQAAWVRPLESWKPRHHSAPRQFASLVRHLFARYDIPACLDSVWFLPNQRQTYEQQEWFCRAGLGWNLRQVGFPVALTKRMVHVLLTAVPEGLVLSEALRWAQVVGMGGSERLARALCATGLTTHFHDEPFWESVVRFFVNHPLLDLAQVGPLVDYLRHERETPTYLPAGFTLAGRSPAALIQRMEQWHGHLAQQRKTAHTAWEPAAWKGLSIDEPVPNSDSVVRWTISELTTAKALQSEGAAMHHCVGSYVGSCARGQVSVWSLTRTLPWDAAQQRVMTIAVTPQRYVCEARGKFNTLPSASGRRLNTDESQTLVRGWRYFLLWAAREGLTVPAYFRH